ncbi:hypothetical protein QW180_17380 [Vibrio sinaloensis]|nr:hypothetical protein [Vibrio sinaloensis]
MLRFFFLGSIPLALFYNLQYEFPLDSNLKVLFGMTLFGFFTGLILQLVTKLEHFESLAQHKGYNFQLNGERQSMVKQMILMVSLLLVTLTTMLAMIAVKDIFWLEHNPDRVLDGTGKVSVIKEFIYIAVVLGGYAISIMVLWSKSDA